MKILFVNDYSQRVGGTETYLNLLMNGLRSSGHDVDVYFGSDNFNKSVNDRNRLASYLNRIFSIRNFLLFRKKMIDFQPDVVHIQNIFNEVSPSILLHCRNVPVIMTIHDYHLVQAVFTHEDRNGRSCGRNFCPGCLNCVGLKGMIFERFKRFVHSFLLKEIDLFIAPSVFMREVIKNNSRYDPVLIYGGIIPAQESKIRDTHTALYSGRLAEGKGVAFLLNAIPEILKNVPNFRLIIAGEGDEKDELMTISRKLKLDRNVVFLGNIPQSEMFKLYQKSTLLVVPSTWPETFGLVCIEALSSGRPVVATKVGGIPEIIKHNINGYLCEPANSKSIAKYVTHLMKDLGTLNRISAQAHRSVEQFNIGVHIEMITKTYRKLLL